MGTEQLNLKTGEWLVADCGKMPSESNCQLVVLAPKDQKEDLVTVGVQHAIQKHGHQDSEELRQGIANMLVNIQVD